MHDHRLFGVDGDVVVSRPALESVQDGLQRRGLGLCW